MMDKIAQKELHSILKIYDYCNDTKIENELIIGHKPDFDLLIIKGNGKPKAVILLEENNFIYSDLIDSIKLSGDVDTMIKTINNTLNDVRGMEL